MAIAAVSALRRTVSVDWPRALDEDARKFLVSVALRGNEEIIGKAYSRSGFKPGFMKYANTPGREHIENVQLPGPIVFLYDYRLEVADATLKELRRRSPVDSGMYANSHMVYVNDVPVYPLPSSLNVWDNIFISNPVPYARRLEVGKTDDGRSFVINAEYRLYESVAKGFVRRKYKEVAGAAFGYVQLPGAWVIRGGLSLKYKALDKGITRTREVLRSRRQKPGSVVRAPAIFIKD